MNRESQLDESESIQNQKGMLMKYAFQPGKLTTVYVRGNTIFTATRIIAAVAETARRTIISEYAAVFAHSISEYRFIRHKIVAYNFYFIRSRRLTLSPDGAILILSFARHTIPPLRMTGGTPRRTFAEK